MQIGYNVFVETGGGFPPLCLSALEYSVDS